MSPVPVAAAKNTSTVVEGEIMMSDELLEQTLQEVTENIDKMSKSDESLTRKEKRHYGNLLRRKQVLSQIKTAKENKHKDAELYHTMLYDLMLTIGEKHPILMFITTTMMRVRWGAGSFQRL